MKNGKLLDPKYGGSGSAKMMDLFEKNSEKYVHITGVHKEFLKPFLENEDTKEMFTTILENKWIKRVKDTPLFNVARAGVRKIERLIYRATSTLELANMKDFLENPQPLIEKLGTKGKVIKANGEILFVKKQKLYM